MESHTAKKSEKIVLPNTCKNTSAYARFEHETSGLKNKHLTTRQRTSELCDLPRETRVVARKKRPHFPITLAYRKCKNTCKSICFTLRKPENVKMNEQQFVYKNASKDLGVDMDKNLKFKNNFVVGKINT